MSPITYTSEQGKEYSQALTKADTLSKLRALLDSSSGGWGEVCADAAQIVEGMSEQDFEAFRLGLAKEREGGFAGYEFAERYGVVMMPEVLLRVASIAIRFRVPWGCAYLRLKETGNLERALKGIVADGLGLAVEEDAFYRRRDKGPQ